MTRAALHCNLESLLRMELDQSFILLNIMSYEEVLGLYTYCLKKVEEQWLVNIMQYLLRFFTLCVNVNVHTPL